MSKRADDSGALAVCAALGAVGAASNTFFTALLCIRTGVALWCTVFWVALGAMAVYVCVRAFKEKNDEQAN